MIIFLFKWFLKKIYFYIWQLKDSERVDGKYAWMMAGSEDLPAEQHSGVDHSPSAMLRTDTHGVVGQAAASRTADGQAGGGAECDGLAGMSSVQGGTSTLGAEAAQAAYHTGRP